MIGSRDMCTIAGSENSRSHAADFADLAGNVVVMFDKGCKKWEENLIHEPGPTLGLPHSFYTTCLMVPEKVDFNKTSWHHKLTPDPSSGRNAVTYDYLAYAATYYNIMDYESTAADKNKGNHNLYFQRSLFTKWQWFEMTKNIKNKLYLATILGSLEGFAGIDESHLKSINEEIMNILY